ncbi:thioesterase family protein [Streptomyces sp. NA04227]|uniref:thioesterase family protein n=1 Tax=Streptomyces sp. NA04227 TaxID=2742136 RepID=UPI0026DF7CC8|nr:thioesterase family protein [Streptomyces sp. NA04227]
MLLRKPAGEWVETAEHLKGFGGFHGGLALGMLSSAMSAHVPGLQLQSITGRFGRIIDGGFGIESALVRSGRTSSTVSAKAESPKGVHLEATGVFSVPGEQRWPLVAPKPPQAPPPEDCEVFAIPKEFVPISQSMEIRPVGSARPYAGGPEPELVAWIRLLEDDEAPDAARFVFLMDALAPSYAAMLSELVFVPTVELTVRPGEGLATATSPWILLRASTLAATSGGWIDEQIDAWGLDGTHLGTAHQLRVVRKI